MPPTFRNARQLVDEFKKSGEFDRLRRQLLTHFTNSDEVGPLMGKVEEIAREKLSTDARLEHKRGEQVYSEVMQELERYPVVENAVSDLDVLKDQNLITSIEQYMQNIIKGESNDTIKLWNAHRKCFRCVFFPLLTIFQHPEPRYYVAMNDNSSESTFDEEADERKAHSNVSKKESRPIIKGTTAESRSPQPGSSEPSPQRRPPQDQPQVNHYDHKSPPWSESCPMNQHDAKPRARPYPDMSMGTSSLAVPPSNAVTPVEMEINNATDATTGKDTTSGWKDEPPSLAS